MRELAWDPASIVYHHDPSVWTRSSCSPDLQPGDVIINQSWGYGGLNTISLFLEKLSPDGAGEIWSALVSGEMWEYDSVLGPLPWVITVSKRAVQMAPVVLTIDVEMLLLTYNPEMHLRAERDVR